MARSHRPFRLNKAELLDTFLPMLESRSPSDVRMATLALAEMGAAAVPSLCARLLDPEGRPHLHVVAVLNQIGVDTVARALPELGMVEKASALHYLGAIGRQHVTNAVLEQMQDDEATVRAAAARTLGRLQDKRALTALEQAVRDPDVEVRATAIEALGRLGAVRSLPLLVAALLDRHVSVRRNAATVLADARDPSTGEALMAALLDEDVVVRAQAALGIGRLERVEATPRLIAIALHDRARARDPAIVALGRCGDATAIGPLCSLLSGDEETQFSTCKALAALAQRHPDPHLRAALPELRRLARVWPSAPVRVRSAAAQARDVIENVTARVRNLPMTANGKEAATANLPIPGD